MPTLAENRAVHQPQLREFSPVIGVFELAELLKKSPAAIFADRSRAPHRLPPDCTPPGTQKPLWLLSDVLDWLRQYRQQAPASPAAPAPRRRGRPTKAEALARTAATAAKGGEQ